MTPLRLHEFRREAETFLGALDKELYDHYSGQKEVCDTASIYESHPGLFTLQAVRDLEQLYGAARDDEKRRLAYLLAFAADGYLGAETRHLADAIANAEAEAVVEVDGERIGYRYASVVQSNEADPARRRRLLDARLGVVEETLTPLLDRLWRSAHQLATGLGQPNYLELYAEIRGVDYLHLRAELEGFLQDTAGLYERILTRVVSDKLGIDVGDLHHADLPYLFRAPGYDHVFTADGMLPTLLATLTGLGVDLASQSNVHLDTEVRALKSPRAFCCPVRVPDEIYLVVLPKGGQDDYVALLHEAGHTEHYAHTRRDLAFEYRHLGDNAVTEGFAFLMDHLTLNPRWHAVHLGATDPADYIAFATFVELFFLRRYAAKLAYETELHACTGSLDAMAAVYSRRLSDALLVEVPPQSYLDDVDAGMYVASYVRAWLLEGALRMMLQDRHGMEWFRDAAAGEWLRGLWSMGQQFTADQLLLKNGGGRLDADPLRHLIERTLGR